MCPRRSPEAVCQALADVVDSLGDAQMGLVAIIEYGGGLDSTVRSAKLTAVSRRLRRLADGLVQDHSTCDKERRVRSVHLVEEILQVADKAELLTAQVAMAEDLPSSMRARASDRLLQLVSLLRLAVTDIEPTLGVERATLPRQGADASPKPSVTRKDEGLIKNSLASALLLIA